MSTSFCTTLFEWQIFVTPNWHGNRLWHGTKGAAGRPPASNQGYPIRSEAVLFTCQSVSCLAQWRRFAHFVHVNLPTWGVKHWRATLESCKNGRLHVHVMPQFQKVRTRVSRNFLFEGISPNASANDLLNEGMDRRNPQQSIDGAFFNAFASKIGTMRDEGNEECELATICLPGSLTQTSSSTSVWCAVLEIGGLCSSGRGSILAGWERAACQTSAGTGAQTSGFNNSFNQLSLTCYRAVILPRCGGKPSVAAGRQCSWSAVRRKIRRLRASSSQPGRKRPLSNPHGNYMEPTGDAQVWQAKPLPSHVNFFPITIWSTPRNLRRPDRHLAPSNFSTLAVRLGLCSIESMIQAPQSST